uniref:Uncharacterized protein n=1 Tax=Caenorhabditis japonica TaxID=281687 RepID=A0A8R1ED99_CAEJA
GWIILRKTSNYQKTYQKTSDPATIMDCFPKQWHSDDVDDSAYNRSFAGVSHPILFCYVSIIFPPTVILFAI